MQVSETIGWSNLPGGTVGAERTRIEPDSTVVVTDHQVSVELEGEVLILHLKTAGYYSLRNVAARVWALLERPSRVSEIGAALAREYGVALERCERDVLELLEDLRDRELVEITS